VKPVLVVDCVGGIAVAAALSALAMTRPSESGPAPAAAVATTCAGQPATLIGSAGPDELVGTVGNDVIQAGPGDDRILAMGSDDVVCAGPGDDVVDDTAETGRFGAGGSDLLLGGPGDDLLADGPWAKDRLLGGSGDDELRAITGRGDTFGYPGPPEKILDGGPGADVLVSGGDNENRMLGGPGPDVLRAEEGNVSIEGGAGRDVVWASRGFGSDVSLLGDGDVVHVRTPANPGPPDDPASTSMWLDYSEAPGPVVVDVAGGSGKLAGSDVRDRLVRPGNASFFSVDGTTGDDGWRAVTAGTRCSAAPATTSSRAAAVPTACFLTLGTTC
jgi:Ca2+-binding RTX toxin-like protein